MEPRRLPTGVIYVGTKNVIMRCFLVLAHCRTNHSDTVGPGNVCLISLDFPMLDASFIHRDQATE